MKKRVDHAREGIRIIDEFFDLDSKMSEEDKLHQGLSWAVEHGWMSQSEADNCMLDYVNSRNENPADSTGSTPT